MKKILISLLSLAMAVGALAGCSGGASEKTPDSGASIASSTDGTVEPASTGDVEVSDPGVYPIVKEKTKLTIFMHQVPNITDYDDNTLTKWLEDTSNVDIVWNLVPKNDRDQKLNLILASGENLPDVIIGGISSPMLIDYATQGMFQPLTKLIDTQAVNLKAALDLYPGTREILTAPNGEIYSMPAITDVLGNRLAGRMWVNKPWLDKLGLEIPTTTDEFADMLRAFRDKDPNGNGKKDEIPMMGSTDGWAGQFDRFLMNSFIQYYQLSPYMVQNNVITPEYDTEEYREGLRYLKMLVSEGLYDTASFSQTNEQLRVLMENEDPLLGAVPCGGPSTFGTAGSPRQLDYVPISPLKGPNGVQWAENNPYGYLPHTNTMVVTSACKNPAVAVKLIDLLYSEEGGKRARWGVPDVDYVPADPGSLDGLGRPAKYKSLFIWGSQTNLLWGGDHPQLENFSTTAQQIQDPNVVTYPLSNDYIAQEMYVKYSPPIENFIKPMMYDVEDSAKLNEIESTLNPYITESRTLFTTGRMDIEKDWDSYLQELEKIGYKDVVAIMQKRYDEIS